MSHTVNTVCAIVTCYLQIYHVCYFNTWTVHLLLFFIIINNCTINIIKVYITRVFPCVSYYYMFRHCMSSFVFVSCICLVCTVVILCVFAILCVYCSFILDAGLLARSQYPEGPATGHLDTGFSWFPCVYKRMLR
jgi:hypothetical protein